ncbi:Allantoinase [Candidatus Norongarragalina meridionalis]|nr:Allantoinase [Candidatus Norongarragalina meridionalis]
MFCLRNCNIVGLGERDVLFDSKIRKIGKNLRADESFDARGMLLLPGLIDSHVHFREPGGEQKEGWETGSRAAAHGGITCVLDMPNTSPPTTSVAALEEKRRLVSKRSIIDYGLHFGATSANVPEIMRAKNIPAIKVFLGSSTGSLLLDENVHAVFAAAKKKKKPAFVHAEDEGAIKRFGDVFRKRAAANPRTYSAASIHSMVRSNAAAAEAASRALRIAEKTGNRIHLAHCTTAQEAEIIAYAKKKGVHVTMEVTPHHLFLTSDDMKKLGNYGKVNPPLRSLKDVDALWAALRSGVVDTIATDHAPHMRGEKEADYWAAPSGMPGVETMLPLLLNAVSKRLLALEDVQRLCCENPAKIFGVKNKGRIAAGCDADMTIVDLRLAKKVRSEELLTKCKWSAFEGMPLKGWPVRVWSRGAMVFDGETIIPHEGREASFD